MEVAVERRNISFPNPDAAKLDRLAKDKDVTFPQLVRDAVKEYLERHKDEIPA
jgi:hypothetical protein